MSGEGRFFSGIPHPHLLGDLHRTLSPSLNFIASRDARVTRRLGSLRYNSRRASLNKLRSEDVGVRDARPLGHNAILWDYYFPTEGCRKVESLSRKGIIVGARNERPNPQYPLCHSAGEQSRHPAPKAFGAFVSADPHANVLAEQSNRMARRQWGIVSVPFQTMIPAMVPATRTPMAMAQRSWRRCWRCK